MNKKNNLNIEKIFNLALQDHKVNKFKSTENTYKKILIKYPNHFNTLYLLGTLNFQIQKFNEARKNFELNDAMANFLNLKDGARLYDYVMSLWMQYLSIFKINHCEVKYENIIKDFKPTVNSVLKFLNLLWNNSVVKYSTTAKERDNIATPCYNQVIKPLYSHASGRWERYENQMSNINPFLKKWLGKCNY